MGKKNRETALERTQRPFEKPAREGTPIPSKETARERTREPLKNQLKKVEGSEEAKGKEVEEKEEECKEEKRVKY